MVTVEDDIVAELESKRKTLTVDEMVRIVETNHSTDGPGVEREVFDAYADAVAFDEDVVPGTFDERLTDADSWVESGRVYDLGDGRVSAYPSRWHGELGDTTDLQEYLRIIGADAGVADDEGGPVTENGVQEEFLLDAGNAIGDIDRDDGRDQLKRLRDAGEIEAYPSQHANPWVRLVR